MTRLVRTILIAQLLIAAPAMAQYRTFIGGKNKIRYDQFDWKVYSTPHFQISYYDRVEPSLERIASYAESSYDELARKLNYQILEPIPLLAYATHAEFEQTNVVVDFIPEGVGAFATPVRNRMVLPVDLADRQLQALIQHELTHIFQYEILFQGRISRLMFSRPPLWFMEGMASYLGDDEDARDEMFMRDAALSDAVPSVGSPFSGFLAYRFGHKVFEYIEAEWGEEGLRDFILAFRDTFGGRIARPFQRVFNMDPEEFDAGFRSWLRSHYSEHQDRGTPREFGRRFRASQVVRSQDVSPVAAPSGDLVAAFTTYKNDLDVVLFGVPDRRLYRNLTRGQTRRWEYLVAQGLSVAPDRGRDLAFSPDGNLVAVFGRTERTRHLFLLDANRGGIAREVEIPLPIDQPMAPTWSPDGRRIAFRAFREGHSDIFLLDLDDESIVNLTEDEASDSAPAFAPRGGTIVFSSEVGQWHKLVEISVDDRTQRRQLTDGPGNDEGAVFSADGERMYFASDREGGVLDVYVLDLGTRRLSRLTHVIGGAMNPAPVQTLDGERVVFQAFSRGNWELYLADPNLAEPVGEVAAPSAALEPPTFLPAVTIPVDTGKGVEVGRRRLFLEDAQAFVGVDETNTVVSQTYLSWSDQYGDRRFTALLNSVDTFSDFRLSYVNLEPRLQWGAQVFDDRSFFIYGYDPLRQQFVEREQVYRETGAAAMGFYPISRYYRMQGSVGYIDRSADLPYIDDQGQLAFLSYDDQIPYLSAGVVGDTTSWRRYGPHAGSRWDLNLTYGYDLDEGGTLTRQAVFEGRKYLPLSDRNEIALRLYLAAADGNRPSVFYFGGFDTLRAMRIRSLSGNRAGYANVEWRFPLIDRLDFSFMRLGEVRGRVFLDLGAAWYDVDGVEYNYIGEEGFTFIDSGRLVDGVSAYGVGISLTLFGLPMHWDFAKRWDLKDTLGDLETDFWIGWKF